MDIMNKVKVGALSGLLTLLPMGAQAGLIIEIENLLNGADVVTISDNGAGDNDGDAGIISTIWTSVTGSKFNINSSSGAPSLAELFDTQLNTNLSAGGSFKITISDDTYSVGLADALFQTTTTPTLITSGVVATLASYVNGQQVLSPTGLSQSVLTDAIAAVSLSDPFTIEHVLTLTNTSSVLGKFTADTLTTTVPEPGLLALFGISLLGLGLARPRSRKAAV